MNVSNLQKNNPLLMGYLVDNGYSVGQKHWIKRCIKLVLNEGVSTKVDSYEQLYLEEVKRRGYKADAPVRRNLKSALGCVRQFDIEGVYPQPHITSGFMAAPKSYELLHKEYKAIIDNYIQTVKRGPKRSTTIDTERRAVIQFFTHIQKSGIESITEVTERSVLDFFFDGEKMIRGKDYKAKIVPVLHTATALNEEAIKKMLSYFPLLQKKRINYPYLTMEESKRFQMAICKEPSNLTLLDRALAAVAYYTGLRGTDITSLILDNINWDQATINLVQSKTGNELTLPMNAIVGNAIWDYLTKERPTSKEQYIFVTPGKPHKQINFIWRRLKKVFDEANIRKDGGKTGVRIFRHHLATRLLGNEIPAPIISSILGHTDPESINPYVDADLEHLKACSISITDYTISKEVFEL